MEDTTQSARFRPASWSCSSTPGQVCWTYTCQPPTTIPPMICTSPVMIVGLWFDVRNVRNVRETGQPLQLRSADDAGGAGEGEGDGRQRGLLHVEEAWVSNSEEQRLQVDAPLPPAPWPCPLALRAARVVVRCTGQCVECFTWIPLSSHRTKVPLKSTTDSQSLMRFTQQITACTPVL